jgi:hypothetical protein
MAVYSRPFQPNRQQIVCIALVMVCGGCCQMFYYELFYKLQCGPRRSQLSNLSSCRFTRRYWGNPCWFLFLRLLIFSRSAGIPTYPRSTRIKIWVDRQAPAGPTERVTKPFCTLIALEGRFLHRVTKIQ